MITHVYELNFHHLSNNKSVSIFIKKHFYYLKWLKHHLACDIHEIKHLSYMPRVIRISCIQPVLSASSNALTYTNG